MLGSFKSIKVIVLFSLTIITVSALGQVSGVVKSKQTAKVISGVDVFINKTSIVSSTNSKGEFELNGIAPGFYDLILSHDGYEIFKSALRIQEGKGYKLNLDINEVQFVKPSKQKVDDEWKKNMQWFERAFLGTSANAVACKITNTKLLNFQSTGGTLRVSAGEPLNIENAALGYKITCYLQAFQAGVDNSSMQALIRFDTMATKDDGQKITWERNRLKAYWGSEQHFFNSLVVGNADEQGFQLFNEAGVRLNTDSLAKPGKIAKYHRIGLTGKTKILYQIEAGSSGIQQHDQAGQVSWLTPKSSIEVSDDGVLFNVNSVDMTGHMGYDKIADMLPQNYIPTSTLESEQLDWKNFGLLKEKVYLQTDRDYYYPRENIWFKAYMGYTLPVFRDTLSRTLYIDFISPDKKILRSKTYKIKKGVSWGDFKLPDSLRDGQYYLRAYTNWMRNYGDSTFFVKTIPILSFSQNLDASLSPPEQVKSPFSVTVKSAKNEFGKRELVNLDIEIKDASQQPVSGHLSVSVTDAYAAIPIAGSATIASFKFIPSSKLESQKKYFDQINYFMERGISIKGRVKDDKGNPVAANLEIIQGNMDNLIMMETEEDGDFVVIGLDFQDSAVFAFKPTNKKGKLFKEVEILPYKTPGLEFLSPPISLRYKNENILQRIQNTYYPGEDVKLLDEVEVKAKRIDTEGARQAKIYGTPDYTVKGDNIRSTAAGTNFLVGLQGKVPGLQVVESMDGGGLPTISVRLRGGTSSLSGATSPLILVDGVPFPDPNSIAGLDASNIDRVEVITRAVPQYGSRGTNGVIAIFTKAGAGASSSEKNFLAYKIPGYTVPRQFESPDYGKKAADLNPDFRTTIFWSPNLQTNEEGVTSTSFYTADLETRYRIVIEGISNKGVPFRVESFIEVN